MTQRVIEIHLKHWKDLYSFAPYVKKNACIFQIKFLRYIMRQEIRT